MHDILPSSYSSPITVLNVRGTSLCNFYGRHAWNSGASHLERRNGYRAAEKGGGTVGEEVALEKHSGCLREVLAAVVLTVREAYP